MPLSMGINRRRTSAVLVLDVYGKGDKYCERPLALNHNSTIEAYADVRAEADDVPLVDVQTRTVERWVKNVAETCLGETDSPSTPRTRS